MNCNAHYSKKKKKKNLSIISCHVKMNSVVLIFLDICAQFVFLFFFKHEIENILTFNFFKKILYIL